MEKTAHLHIDRESTPPFKLPTCLVTSAGSFLGVAICDSLLAQNCRVVALDKEENLSQLAKFSTNKYFKAAAGDLTRHLPSHLPKVDYIFHLAGAVGSGDSRWEMEDLLLNSMGTYLLAEKALTDGAKFILASTIEVYYGALSGVSLEYYFGPKKEDFAHYSHHEAKRYAEALLAEYAKNQRLSVVICRVGQLYGPGMDLGGSSIVGDLITQALGGEELVVKGDRLETFYPTYIGDVAYGFIKAAFDKHTKGRIFSLVDETPVTLSDFAQVLVRAAEKVLGKELTITFQPPNEGLSFPPRKPDTKTARQVLGWEPKTNLLVGLEQTLAYFSKLPLQTASPQSSLTEVSPRINWLGQWWQKLIEKGRVMRKPVPKTRDDKTTRLSKVIKFFITGLLVIIMAFGGKTAIDGLIASSKCYESSKFLQKHEFTDTFIAAFQGHYYLEKLIFDLDFFNKVTFNRVPFLVNSLRVAQVARDACVGLGNLALAALKLTGIIDEIIKADSNGQLILNELTESRSFFDIADEKWALAVAELNTLPEKPLLGERGNGLVANLKTRLNQGRATLSQIKPLYDLAPSLLGFDKEQIYLVILQNNAELRATGGFIGSYAEIRLANGHLKQLFVDDVYNIDGQLKEKIPAPPPFQKYLNMTNWYLRDANWDPDFPTSAMTLLDFYQKETGTNADAVIALDVDVIRSLLTLTGPVDLPEYGEVIDANNLFSKAIYYSEIGFTPGSQNKKNFLSSLTRQLLARVLDPSFSRDLGKIGQIVADAAAHKHLQLYFENVQAQQLVAQRGWSGQLVSLIDPVTNRLSSDYLLVVDSNLGANKTNHFLSRFIEFTPTIQRDGDVVNTLQITYKNESPANTWPGGDYKNYLRVYTPAGSVLESIDNGENTSGDQVEAAFRGDKVVYGFWVEVPVKKEVKVVLKWRQPLTIIREDQPATYQLAVQKQAGTKADVLRINLEYPAYLRPVKYPSQAILEPQQIKLETVLDTDKTYRVEFARH